MKDQKRNLMKDVKKMWIIAMIPVITAFGCSHLNSNEEQRSEIVEEQPLPPGMDIQTAALIGDLDVIKQHIAAGSNLDQKDPNVGSSPLITATVFGKTEVARALIEAGADVNFQNNEGSTPLHCAAFLCHQEIVEMLLQHGADKSLRNNYGSTPLESVSGPFSSVIGIYKQFSKDLGPLGFKLNYNRIEEDRPIIAGMLK